MIGGARVTKVGGCAATYSTMAGPVVVERSLYREVGRRNAKVVDPVSLRAGVVQDGWLPRTASAMAHQVQQVTSSEAEESARQLGRLPYSRSSFERGACGRHALTCRRTGTSRTAHRAVRGPRGGDERQRVERPGERADGGTAAAAGGTAEEGCAETARGAQLPHGSHCHRDPARYGVALHTLRYGRMPQGDAKNLCEGLGADVAVLLAKRPWLKVAALCDGAAELWNLLAEPLGEGPSEPRPISS